MTLKQVKVLELCMGGKTLKQAQKDLKDHGLRLTTGQVKAELEALKLIRLISVDFGSMTYATTQKGRDMLLELKSQSNTLYIDARK